MRKVELEQLNLSQILRDLQDSSTILNQVRKLRERSTILNYPFDTHLYYFPPLNSLILYCARSVYFASDTFR